MTIEVNNASTRAALEDIRKYREQIGEGNGEEATKKDLLLLARIVESQSLIEKNQMRNLFALSKGPMEPVFPDLFIMIILMLITFQLYLLEKKSSPQKDR